MRPLRSLIVACVVPAALILLSCGSVKESEESTAMAAPVEDTMSTAAPASIIDFETMTDTVRPESRGYLSSADSQGVGEEVRFMIQIGAFKEPHNANMSQQLARERYRMSVLNDFHTPTGLYQVRLGFFETYEAAHSFMERMRSEFPEDYKDSWVVQLTRQ